MEWQGARKETPLRFGRSELDKSPSYRTLD
jgi:hypothetical protein